MLMNMKRILSMIMVICVVAVMLCSCESQVPEYSRTSFAFDTYVTFRIFKTDGVNTPEAVCDSAVAMLNDLENKLSIKKDNSEISKINDLASTAPVKVDEQIYWLIRNSVDLSNLTEGAFDITLGEISYLWGFYSDEPEKPDFDKLSSFAGKESYKKIVFDDENKTIFFKDDSFTIDLGAVGKGYALDMLKTLFTESGVTSGLVDFGGSILTVGKYNEGSWTVSISDGTKDGIAGKVTLPAVVYSTSNASNRYVEYDDMKYHHIIDGNTAFPADSDVQSCTVICDNGLISDALSTAFFVMGKDKALEFYKNYPIVEFIITDKSGNVIVSDSIVNSFEAEKNG